MAGIERAREALRVCEEMEIKMDHDYDLCERFERARRKIERILREREREEWNRAFPPPRDPADDVIESFRAIGVNL